MAWTDKGEPVVLAVLSTKADAEAAADEPLLAGAARVVIADVVG
ncbi:hypothetical protein [Streptomyces parvulus]